MEDKTLILLVDDDRLNLKRAQEILLEENYAVAATLSGEQALGFLEKKTPDLILLDIYMPGIDGFETLEKIRQLENGKDVPVIFLTAADDTASEIRGFEGGADDFITKPFVNSIVKRRVARSLESSRLRKNLQKEVEKQTRTAEERCREVERLSVEVIQTLTTAIDAKDPYTKGHSGRVAEYSVILAKALGWDEARVDNLRFMAMLHDVGKIGVPDRVLNKAGRLATEEYEIIKSHTTVGDDILRGVSSLSSISDVARHHHERYDGRGYPDGLQGKDISIEARIVGIADAYDAMSSDRVYRKALPQKIICSELKNGKGTQFDPELLDVFYDLFVNGELELKSDTEHELIHELDIHSLVDDYLKSDYDDGVMNLTHSELQRMYAYLKNFGDRYNSAFSVILITLNGETEVVPDDHMQKAMAAMEYSIIQTLRKTDMLSKVNKNQMVVVLTQAAQDKIQMIIDRIFTGFYKNCLYTDIKPTFDAVSR